MTDSFSEPFDNQNQKPQYFMLTENFHNFSLSFTFLFFFLAKVVDLCFTHPATLPPADPRLEPINQKHNSLTFCTSVNTKALFFLFVLKPGTHSEGSRSRIVCQEFFLSSVHVVIAHRLTSALLLSRGLCACVR